MQPLTETERRPITANTTLARLRGDEAELYRRHHSALVRAVARVVNAPRELIEDACQNAWTILLRRQPERSSIFAWLRVVAIHEAFQLCRRDQRDAHLEDLCHGDGWDALIACDATIDSAVEARQALRLVAQLPERQRDDLSLLIAGFSYREIAHMTGGRTFTNVNKHLVKARSRLREHDVRPA